VSWFRLGQMVRIDDYRCEKGEVGMICSYRTATPRGPCYRVSRLNGKGFMLIPTRNLTAAFDF